MLSFLISALRAVVEMLGLCLLAQAVLHVLAGRSRQNNPVYRFFALLTRGPQQIVARCLPIKLSPGKLAVLTFLLLLILWLGLAALRKII